MIELKDKILVDDTQAHLAQYPWKLDTSGYPRTQIEGKTVYLHRLICPADKGYEVDHINHNKLDNTAANLRVCTGADNKHNAPLQRNNSSGYKGVSWDKQRNKWRAQLKLDNRKIYIGLYPSPEEAAGAYYSKALELFGDYAYVA